MNRLRCLLIIGTRPEAIKMAPLVHECRRKRAIESVVCSTGQHREMLTDLLEYFEIVPEITLELMQGDQTLAGITARSLQEIDEVITRVAPDNVVAQGDTATVMAASAAAFFRRVPFVHVEAGLRTGNLQSPWPEEFNRRVVSLATSLHCAPTQGAADHLISEGADPACVHVTGNTVVDALRWTLRRERERYQVWARKYQMLGGARVVLITGHRRESFGEKLSSVCRAVEKLAERFADTAFVFPVHPNPAVHEPVRRILGDHRNIHLIQPVCYPEFVWLMERATFFLTDSGGLQEEAVTLRKPVLLTRDTTERPEAVDAGAVQLVGASTEGIIAAAARLLGDQRSSAGGRVDRNPYGDGDAARKIVELMLQVA